MFVWLIAFYYAIVSFSSITCNWDQDNIFKDEIIILDLCLSLIYHFADL